MGQAQIIVSGTVTVMPLTVAGTTTSVSPQGSLPAGSVQIPLSTTPSPKPSNRRAVGSVYLQSPSSFQTLHGVGTSENVTTGDFLLLTTDGPIQLQLTMQDYAAAGVGTTVSTVYVYGQLHLELPPSGYLVGLAAQGTANVEYTISGPA